MIIAKANAIVVIGFRPSIWQCIDCETGGKDIMVPLEQRGLHIQLSFDGRWYDGSSSTPLFFRGPLTWTYGPDLLQSSRRFNCFDGPIEYYDPYDNS
jgi:hypothetical protein